MPTEQMIPLNQLILSKANVRRTAANEGIGDLAASIAAHGLRQNLNVLPSKKVNHFEVVAGGRRLRAMKMLAKSGKLAEDAPVSCLVLAEGEDAGEISLVENAMRTAMHAVQTKQGRNERHGHADRLAVALSFDMTPWWTPTVEGFFNRLPKSALAQTVADAKVTAEAPFDGLKKAEAAKMAAKALKDSGWLPAPLRTLS